VILKEKKFNYHILRRVTSMCTTRGCSKQLSRILFTTTL